MVHLCRGLILDPQVPLREAEGLTQEVSVGTMYIARSAGTTRDARGFFEAEISYKLLLFVLGS
jgi:hypothetical protein